MAAILRWMGDMRIFADRYINKLKMDDKGCFYCKWPVSLTCPEMMAQLCTACKQLMCTQCADVNRDHTFAEPVEKHAVDTLCSCCSPDWRPTCKKCKIPIKQTDEYVVDSDGYGNEVLLCTSCPTKSWCAHDFSPQVRSCKDISMRDDVEATAAPTEEEMSWVKWAKNLGSFIVKDVSVTYDSNQPTNTVRMVDGFSKTDSDFLAMWRDLTKPDAINKPELPDVAATAREKARHAKRAERREKRKKRKKSQRLQASRELEAIRKKELEAIRKNVATATI